MRKVAPALLLAAAACGSGDNVVIGSIPESNITPFIAFDNIQSVISGAGLATCRHTGRLLL